MSNKTVTMLFPKKLSIFLDDHTPLHFKEGLNEVPEEHAEHWYLKKNGVKVYGKEDSDDSESEESNEEDSEEGQPEDSETPNGNPQTSNQFRNNNKRRR